MINNVITYLEDAVLVKPDKIAFQDEFCEFTFTEVKSVAKKVAHSIYNDKKLNQPVAVILPRGCFSVLSFLGIAYSGNFYTPIDPRVPAERVSRVLMDLQPFAVIMNKDTFDRYKDIIPSDVKIYLIEEIISSDESDNQTDFSLILKKKVDSDPLYCIYTSGSTGAPKGVLVSHKSLIDYIEYATDSFNIDETTIFGNQAQFHFDISALDIYSTLKARARTVIVPERHFTFTKNLVTFLNQYEINFIYWVPSVLNFVAKTDAFSNSHLINLKNVLFAGEVMPVKTLNYLMRLLPNATFINLYGPTEITITCTHYVVDRVFDDREALPIGTASNNKIVFLLDEDNCLIPESVTNKTGEICVRGNCLALGYWRDSKKTREKFTLNPLQPNFDERIYRTGDLAYYNEKGQIMYVGRSDNQIKYMGYRIELEEIEREILNIKGIHLACVIFLENKNEIFCAYESDHFIDDIEIRSKLIEALPKYMLPTRFQKYEKLPISSSGKIDRQQIKTSANNSF